MVKEMTREDVIARAIKNGFTREWATAKLNRYFIIAKVKCGFYSDGDRERKAIQWVDEDLADIELERREALELERIKALKNN